MRLFVKVKQSAVWQSRTNFQHISWPCWAGQTNLESNPSPSPPRPSPCHQPACWTLQYVFLLPIKISAFRISSLSVAQGPISLLGYRSMTWQMALILSSQQKAELISSSEQPGRRSIKIIKGNNPLGCQAKRKNTHSESIWQRWAFEIALFFCIWSKTAISALLCSCSSWVCSCNGRERLFRGRSESQLE